MRLTSTPWNLFFAKILLLMAPGSCDSTWTDSIPVVSQIKSAVQAISGDSAGALQTQQNFAFNNTFPVISQIASAGYAIGGDNEKALDLQKKFAKDMEQVISTIPVAGHVEGAVYYALGDKDKGEAAMKSASRSTGVAIGGVGGFLAGGPVGAVAGGIAGGAAADGIITGSDILAKGKENATDSGYIAMGNRIKSAVEGKSKISVDEAFDMSLLPVSDAVGGLVAGNVAGELGGGGEAVISAGEGKVNPAMAIAEAESKAKPISIPEPVSKIAKMDKAALDNRANQLNPNHPASGPGRAARYRGKGTKADLDNHANQLNPNNKAYVASRVESKDPAAAATLNANNAQEPLKKGANDPETNGWISKIGQVLSSFGSGLLTVFGGLWQLVLALFTIVVLTLTIVSSVVSCICRRGSPRRERSGYEPIDSSRAINTDDSDTAPLFVTVPAREAGQRQTSGNYGGTDAIC